jgi:hypothetical protein
MSSHVFLAVNKKQSSTIIDFLSLSGGFLGLFAGFSVLSAAEIIYYFVIAPIIECRARRSTRVHPFARGVRAREGIAAAYIRKMLQESSIHGFNHIGNDKKSFIERAVWTLMLIASMVCTYFMVIQVYGKINTSAVSITMEGTATRFEDVKYFSFQIFLF